MPQAYSGSQELSAPQKQKASQAQKETLSACPICNSESFHEACYTPVHMQSSTETFSFCLCGSCASVFLNPRVKANHLQSYYPSTYLPYRGASAWGKYHRFVEWSQRRMDTQRANRCAAYFSPKQPITVLDVGCGRPTFLETLRGRTEWVRTGIDFSPEGWHNFNRNGIILIEGEMQHAHFSHSFDLVTMWHYLEHDYNPRDTLQAVREIMPRGGKLIIEIPDYRSLTARLQKEHWEGWHTPRHASLFSQEGLAALLSQQRFKVIDYYRYGTLGAFTLWWMGVMEKRGIDWSQSMEREFIPLVGQMICTAPLFLLEKVVPLGIQTIVAEAI